MYNHVRIRCEYDENSVCHKAAKAVSMTDIVDARLAAALDKLEVLLTCHDQRQVEIAEKDVQRAWTRVQRQIRDEIRRRDTMNKYLTLALISLCACTTQFAYEDDTHEEGDTAVENDTASDSVDDTATENDTAEESDAPDMTETEACVPSCGVRNCGLDPICGEPCGECTAPESCNTEGQCSIWVRIPAGTFQMGSPETEPGHQDDETLHTVTLTRDFEIQATEVTQGQFEAMMGYNPTMAAPCTACPVDNITWHEAAMYCNVLSTAAGYGQCYTCSGSGTSVNCSPSSSYTSPYDCPGYRLPTEAEWEYAARAGTTGATYNGTSGLIECEMPNTVLDPIAWFCGNAAGTAHPVGSKTANGQGLFDMLGNVWEWCAGSYDGYTTTLATDPWYADMYIIRGGSWFVDAGRTRAAARIADSPEGHGPNRGFRVVQTAF